MEAALQKKNEITEGIIWRQLLKFFFPIVFGTFFQQLYNTADAMIVGRFVGKEALSAVGGTTSVLINLLIGFFVGLSSGATVVLSYYYGGKQEEQVKKVVHTAITLALAGGVVLMIVGSLVAPFALEKMGTPAEIMEHSLTYIRIYFFGTIPNLIYNMGAGLLRAVGDSKRPLYFLIASCFTNIVLDLLLIVVFKMGVAGAAWATILSQVVAAILVCVVLMRTKECYRLRVQELKIHGSLLSRIVQIGLPAGFQSVMYSLSNVIIQSHINSFGTDTVAAWSAYSKIDGIFWMIMGAFGVAITTFVGQNHGAGQNDRVKKSVWVCWGMAAGTSVMLSIVLLCFGQYVFLLFTDDVIVLEKGMEILRFLAPMFITFVSIEIFSGALRGMGKSFIPLLLTCFGVCVFRIVWITIMVPIKPDIFTVIFSYPLTWSTTSVLFLIYYLITIRKMGMKATSDTLRSDLRS